MRIDQPTVQESTYLLRFNYTYTQSVDRLNCYQCAVLHPGQPEWESNPFSVLS